MLKQKTCVHLKAIERIKTAAETVCEACQKTGDSWVHLRTCQNCGVTLCCDSSPNQHASKHFKSSGHPVISSAETGERWLWCYEDKLFQKY